MTSKMKTTTTGSSERAPRGPFAVLQNEGDEAGAAGKTDAIYIRISKHDGMFWFTLPQFEIDVCVPETRELDDMAGEAMREMVTRLLAFRVALEELPEDYMTEVEHAQLRVINDHLVPWFARMLGRHPEHVSIPSDEASVLDGRLAAR